VLDRARSTRENRTIYTTGRAEGGLHDAHVGHQGSPAREFSAQIPQPKTEKQQVNPPRLPRTPNRQPSQVEVFRSMIAQHALGLGRPNYSLPRS